MTAWAHPTAIVGHPPMHRDWRGAPAAWKGYRIGDDAKLEAFVIVEQGIWRPTVVEDGAWLMPYVLVGHDAIVGAGCEVAAHTVIAAHSVVGSGAKLGLGTIMRPGTIIGAGARTGAGAVVVSDIPEGETWVGNPARPLVRRGAPTANLIDDDEAEAMAAAAGISDWADTVGRWHVSPVGERHPCS